MVAQQFLVLFVKVRILVRQLLSPIIAQQWSDFFYKTTNNTRQDKSQVKGAISPHFTARQTSNPRNQERKFKAQKKGGCVKTTRPLWVPKAFIP